MEPNAIGAITQEPTTQPGRTFRRFFDAERFDEARARTAQTGPLDEASACALIDCVQQCGDAFGALEVTPAEADGFPERFLELVTVALGDDGAARRLLDGGVLDRQGVGRHFLGSLPLRIIARELRAETKEAVRASLVGGWDEDLLNLLESAALRAETHPEELLVLTPTYRELAAPARPEPPAPRPVTGLADWLEAAVRHGATDLNLIVGQRASLVGRFGVLELEGPPLEARDAEHVLSIVLDSAARERFDRERTVVTGLTVEELGRFRVTAVVERGRLSCAIRTHLVEPSFDTLAWPSDIAGRALEHGRGLIVVAAPAGHGRSTFFTALLRGHSALGRSVLTLEEPRISSIGGASRQVELHRDLNLDAFSSAARVVRHDVLGIDLIDDAAAAHQALELASEGDFVVLTLRAPSSASALHRLAALDGPRARRRLSESLSAVITLRCFPSKGALIRTAEVLLVSEGLRRHWRANETPAPPILLDTEGPSLDDRLAASLSEGGLAPEDAARWMVDPRRARPG
jgi:Tfp pilus assembly pilus retraction ATPase PilT